MKVHIRSLLFIFFLNGNVYSQTITQEIDKVVFVKDQYLNDKNNSEISLAYYKTYTYPDSAKNSYKIVISTHETKKKEVGNTVGGAAYTGGWGLAFSRIYSKELLEGSCEVNTQEIPQFTKLFETILTTSGEFKVAFNKQKVSSILITETFKNLTFGSELNVDGIQYYFKIDTASFLLTESEFFQIAKFLAKIKRH
ncbi:hypothetical protein [Emticicia sp. W12TSBA100-4]|uniref:hypothetical protein n=1 Tax=Emticicia sp. W12TSBA100-4 TaxID=3160965 RepID=UPI003305A645